MFLRRRVYQHQKKTTPTISNVRNPSGLALVRSCTPTQCVYEQGETVQVMIEEETHVAVTLSKEGETGKHHDGVKENVLVLNQEASRSVKVNRAVVEGGEDAVEEDGVEGEEGKELNVGIVLRVIGNHF